jgi:UDP-glucuronate 4-epimerase
MKVILITGAAGFIGFHAVLRALKDGYRVIGLDNINDYYDVELKFGRLREIGIEKEKIEWDEELQSTIYPNFTFYRTNLEDRESINKIFDSSNFDVVIHLAAQAGVRYSLINPHAYTESNITGFLNILESCRKHHTGHLLYASSSSVYGSNKSIPFQESDNVDHPVSLYAATKKANELMAHTYSHLYKIPTTGLRFFTVYGPWGRPDMAIFLFTKAISEGKPIDVFNNGDMMRDFTYVDDIIEGIMRLINKPPLAAESIAESDQNTAPYSLYNIGNSQPEALMDFINAIELALGKEAIKNMLPMQPGDVVKTWASTENLNQAIDYKPQTTITDGIKKFVGWYKNYYGEQL